MTLNGLTGKQVVIKMADESSHQGHVHAVEAGLGIWLILASNNRPTVDVNQPLFFFPFSQMLWMAAPQ
jgi:hypothetical protein